MVDLLKFLYACMPTEYPPPANAWIFAPVLQILFNKRNKQFILLYNSEVNSKMHWHLARFFDVKNVRVHIWLRWNTRGFRRWMFLKLHEKSWYSRHSYQIELQDTRTWPFCSAKITHYSTYFNFIHIAIFSTGAFKNTSLIFKMVNNILMKISHS